MTQHPTDAAALADEAALGNLWDGLATMNDSKHPAWAGLTHVKDRLTTLRSTYSPATPDAAAQSEVLGHLATVPDHCDRIIWRGSYHDLAALTNKPKD
jgi:hypothetical protein